MWKSSSTIPIHKIKFCKLLAGLGSTNKSASSLPFSSQTVALSLLRFPILVLLFYPTLFGISGRKYLLFFLLLLDYIGSFLPGNDTANTVTRRGALLQPCTIPCSLSPFTSRIHASFFKNWRRTASSKFFDTQVPSVSTEICDFLSCSLCPLSSSMQRTQPSVKH